MAFELLDALRARITLNINANTILVNPSFDPTHLVGDRVYPDSPDIQQRLIDGPLPIISFQMRGNDEDVPVCNSWDGDVAIDITQRRGDNKRELWDLFHALQKTVTAREIQTQLTLLGYQTRVGFFRLRNVDDSVINEASNTQALRSSWATKYTRTV